MRGLLRLLAMFSQKFFGLCLVVRLRLTIRACSPSDTEHTKDSGD